MLHVDGQVLELSYSISLIDTKDTEHHSNKLKKDRKQLV